MLQLRIFEAQPDLIGPPLCVDKHYSLKFSRVSEISRYFFPSEIKSDMIIFRM